MSRKPTPRYRRNLPGPILTPAQRSFLIWGTIIAVLLGVVGYLTPLLLWMPR